MAKLTKVPPKKAPTTNKKPLKKVMKSKKKASTANPEKVVKTEIKKQPIVEKPHVEEKNSKLNQKFVQSGIKALRDLIQKKSEEKKELFDEEQPILMQINLVKVPKCPARVLHLPLSHSFLTSNSEICLFVPDIKEDVNNIEKCVKHYESLLEKKGVTAKIHQIIPLKQLRKEYSEIENKYKLAQLYDYFLVDGRIQGYVFKMFGNALLKANKGLLSVKLQAKELDKLIKKLLCTVDMKVHSKGSTQVIKIGHTDMKDEQLLENVVSAFEAFEKHLPGGSENVRSLMLKTATSLAIPIYVTLKNNSEVNVPVILAPKPKAFKVIKDELSTFTGSNVLVHPSGDVTTIPINATNKKKPAHVIEKTKKTISQKPGRKVLKKPIKNTRKTATKGTPKKTASNQNKIQKPQQKKPSGKKGSPKKAGNDKKKQIVKKTLEKKKSVQKVLKEKRKTRSKVNKK